MIEGETLLPFVVELISFMLNSANLCECITMSGIMENLQWQCLVLFLQNLFDIYCCYSSYNSACVSFIREKCYLPQICSLVMVYMCEFGIDCELPVY